MKSLSMAMLFLLPSLAFGQNLLDCPSTTTDAAGNPMFKSQCTLNSFAPVQASFNGESFEALYTVTLNASCGRANNAMAIHFNAGASAGSRQTFYLNKGSQTFVAQGTGVLSLVDENSNLTRVLRLPPTCQITLESLTFRPVSTVIEGWASEASSYALRLNRSASVFERKAEIMTYQEIYFGSSEAERAEISSVLIEIKGQLDPADENVAIIDAILANASAEQIAAMYSSILTKLASDLPIAQAIQSKLVYASGTENEALKGAITKAVSTLSSQGG